MIHIVWLVLLFVSLFVYTYIIGDIPSSDDFFKFNAAQLFTPIIQAVILIGLAYIINIKLSGRNKQNEILIDEIDEILEAITALKIEMYEYFDLNKATSSTTAKEKESIIFRHLKDISNKAVFLGKLYKSLEYTDILKLNDRPKQVRELRKAITDKHFKQKTNYSTTERQNIEAILDKMTQDYKMEKIEMYKTS